MEPYYAYDGPPPVVYNVARPQGRARGRRPTEAVAAQQPLYMGANGELLVPAAGHHHRSASMSGPRPGGIQIVNEQIYDDGGGRRPRSIVYHDDYLYRPRSRSHSRSPAAREREDHEYNEKMRRLEELEKKDEERELEKQFKEKQLLKKAKEEEEKKEQEEMRKKAVEEWKEKEREKKAKEKEEKEKADKEYEERMRHMLWANGYTNSQIDKMVEKSKKKEKGEDIPAASTSKVIALSRPTYLRIKKKYIDPETLDLYQLPWQWDDGDDEYIIIKKWVNERDQEILFQHTRNLRETKRITYSTNQFRKDKDKQQLLLVKKKDNRGKSPVRIVRF